MGDNRRKFSDFDLKHLLIALVATQQKNALECRRPTFFAQRQGTRNLKKLSRRGWIVGGTQQFRHEIMP
jgi:hypothetical protein